MNALRHTENVIIVSARTENSEKKNKLLHADNVNDVGTKQQKCTQSTRNEGKKDQKLNVYISFSAA